ncbi:MAG: hypothetical protein XE08_0195 [Parcubacteria bacterium 32_520]|nr:MAG: hypothetical protein XE08_0195 [Parcubacteria bacterium 32_520]
MKNSKKNGINGLAPHKTGHIHPKNLKTNSSLSIVLSIFKYATPLYFVFIVYIFNGN